MKHLSVVLKIVERCNINCTYCYMFNMDDQTYMNRPKYITIDTIKSVANFLKNGALELELDKITLEFHGGEPLMLRIQTFDEMCSIFTAELKELVDLTLILQTNAMLINDSWVQAFIKHDVGFGISLDGPKEYHDKYRLDHQGKGTYDRVVKKIRFLQENNSLKKSGYKVSTLSVVQPEFDPKVIYRHFVDELKIQHFDFLLPFYTHNHVIPYPIEMYGKFLVGLFDEWTKDDNPEVSIRFIDSLFSLYNGRPSLIYGVGPGATNNDVLPLINISSNGDLSPTDELRVTNQSLYYTDANVNTTTLKEFLNTNMFTAIKDGQQNLPTICQECCWQKICGGGAIVNRFNKTNFFQNPSVFCNGLQLLYKQFVSYLISNGFSVDEISNKLSLN